MFRRLDNTLPKDPVPPADLVQLGYFINQNDQIRMIDNPERGYSYTVDRNARVNEVSKNAMNGFIRRILQDRLQKLDMEILRLPLGSALDENHVPILISKDLSSKKRIVVLFGERHQDLGILSYRLVGEEGLGKGTILEFVTAILNRQVSTSDEDIPGIIIANPGQLLWYRGGLRAVSYTEWQALPRESAVYEAFGVDEIKNTIPQNRDFKGHVKYIFDHVMTNLTQKDATFDIIGLEYTGTVALEYLSCNWTEWSSRIAGICLGGPQHKLQDLGSKSDSAQSFIDFVSKRCRAYFVSQLPIKAPIKGRDEFGCNCYSGGEEMDQESLIVRSWRSMLEWFDLIHSVPDYEEIKTVIHEDCMNVSEGIRGSP